MKFSSTLALATALLLGGTTACSKREEDPTPPITAAPQTGTFTLDGVEYTRSGFCSVRQDVIKNDTYDTLTISFILSSSFRTEDALYLIYRKPLGSPASQYLLTGLWREKRASVASDYIGYGNALKGSLIQTAAGYSGTFSGTYSSASPGAGTYATTVFGTFADLPK